VKWRCVLLVQLYTIAAEFIIVDNIAVFCVDSRETKCTVEEQNTGQYCLRQLSAMDTHLEKVALSVIFDIHSLSIGVKVLKST